MLFPKGFLALFAIGTTAIGASASPALMQTDGHINKDISDVLAVIATLKATTADILPQIDVMAEAETVVEVDVSPLLDEITDALETSNAALKGLKYKVDTTIGGTKDEVAEAVSVVYSDIAKTLNNLQAKQPQLTSLIDGLNLDMILMKVLFALQAIIPGILKIVAVLLQAVKGLLSALGLDFLNSLLGGLLGGIL